jgi:hypothetical protein
MSMDEEAIKALAETYLGRVERKELTLDSKTVSALRAISSGMPIPMYQPPPVSMTASEEEKKDIADRAMEDAKKMLESVKTKLSNELSTGDKAFTGGRRSRRRSKKVGRATHRRHRRHRRRTTLRR